MVKKNSIKDYNTHDTYSTPPTVLPCPSCDAVISDGDPDHAKESFLRHHVSEHGMHPSHVLPTSIFHDRRRYKENPSALDHSDY
jgi:hypothetical protein